MLQADQEKIKPAAWRKLTIGMVLTTLLSGAVIVMVASGMFNIAASVERFGFYSFRQLHVTLLDATRLNSALKAAALAPGRKESHDFLAEANDLAYIRFVTEDRTELVKEVPRYADISARMEDLIAAIDIVLADGVPMDVPKINRVSGHVDAMLTEMSEIYYAHGNKVNEDVLLADRHLNELTISIAVIMVLFFVLAMTAVVLLVKRHEAALALRHRAMHDALTGLKNRAWLMRNDGKLFDEVDQEVMLFLIDLDRFKDVNDTHGHSVGDALLVRVAEILSTFEVPGKIVPIRFGGDELAMIAIPEDEEDAARLRAKIHQSLNTAVEVDGHELRLGASIGVALYPEHGGDIESLTHYADIALYKAKEAGRARLMVYDPDMMGQPAKKVGMQTRIRAAIADGEFELYWQPIFDLRTATLAGAEAFLRWNDREKDRVLMPKDFLPAAERSDLIYDIDRMVLMHACAEGARWEAELQTDFLISVNISDRHLQTENFPDYLAGVAGRAGLTPSHLEIDITETLLGADRKLAFEAVRRLRELGFRVALDDFGKGTADLQYLAEIDVDRLKIDGDFVKNIERSPKKQGLVSAIIASARAAKTEIVAEGIETPAQMAFLIENGCDYGQGYLLAEPADSETFRTYLRRNAGKTKSFGGEDSDKDRDAEAA